MAKKYHVTTSGDVRVCSAHKQACPYGSLNRHFTNEETAREYYEKHRKTFQKVIIKDHEISLSKEVEKLLELFENNNVKPYIVGGTVRDSLAINATPKDVDIEIHQAKNTDQIIQILKKGNLKVDEVGKQFGVLKVTLKDGMDIDISLPRRDNKSGVGHKEFKIEVDPQMNLSEAADRRDFTINALYYSHKDRKILDPVGGLKDWGDKKLSPISEAFDEDPLRVLRGVQLSARFDLTPDEDYIKAAKRTKDSAKELSIERVQEEFAKLLKKSSNMSAGLETLRKSGWGEYYGFDERWFSNFTNNKKVHFEKIQEECSTNQKLSKNILNGAFIMANMNKEQRKTFSKYILGDRETSKMKFLSETEKPDSVNIVEIKAFARKLGKNKSKGTIQEWIIVHPENKNNRRIEELAKANNVFDTHDSDLITGQLILERTGSTGGVWVGNLIRKANTKQDLGEITKDNYVEWLDSELTNIEY